VSTFEIRFLSVVFISCSLFSSYPTYLGVFHHFAYFLFLFLFESSVSFIFRIDSLATRETIIAVLFCLFSSFYCFLSHIYIYIYIYIIGLRCQVGSIWCWFQFRKNCKKVRREV